MMNNLNFCFPLCLALLQPLQSALALDAAGSTDNSSQYQVPNTSKKEDKALNKSHIYNYATVGTLALAAVATIVRLTQLLKDVENKQQTTNLKLRNIERDLSQTLALSEYISGLKVGLGGLADQRYSLFPNLDLTTYLSKLPIYTGSHEGALLLGTQILDKIINSYTSGGEVPFTTLVSVLSDMVDHDLMSQDSFKFFLTSQLVGYIHGPMLNNEIISHNSLNGESVHKALFELRLPQNTRSQSTEPPTVQSLSDQILHARQFIADILKFYSLHLQSTSGKIFKDRSERGTPPNSATVEFLPKNFNMFAESISLRSIANRIQISMIGDDPISPIILELKYQEIFINLINNLLYPENEQYRNQQRDILVKQFGTYNWYDIVQLKILDLVLAAVPRDLSQPEQLAVQMLTRLRDSLKDMFTILKSDISLIDK